MCIHAVCTHMYSLVNVHCWLLLIYFTSPVYFCLVQNKRMSTLRVWYIISLFIVLLTDHTIWLFEKHFNTAANTSWSDVIINNLLFNTDSHMTPLNTTQHALKLVSHIRVYPSQPWCVCTEASHVTAHCTGNFILSLVTLPLCSYTGYIYCSNCPILLYLCMHCPL